MQMHNAIAGLWIPFMDFDSTRRATGQRCADTVICDVVARILARDLTIEERKLNLRLLINEATGSQRALDLLLRLYQFAAAGEWRANIEELRMLIDMVPVNVSLVLPLKAFVRDINNSLKIMTKLER